MARLLYERGGIIRGISDATGCLVDERPEGINILEVLRHTALKGETICTYPHGQQIAHNDLYDVKADVFVPAAVGGVITGVLAGCAVRPLVLRATSSCTGQWLMPMRQRPCAAVFGFGEVQLL